MKKIYILFWGESFKESWYIRLKNILISLDDYQIVKLFTWNNKFIKILSIFILITKALIVVPRKSIVIFTIPIIKSSIPAFVLKKLKWCKIIWDYDDSSLGNEIQFDDYKQILSKKYKFWTPQYLELFAFKNSDIIIAWSENIYNFAKFNSKKAIKVLNWFDPKLFSVEFLNDSNKSKKLLHKKFNFKQNKIIVGYIGTFRNFSLDIFKTFFKSIKSYSKYQFIFMLNGGKDTNSILKLNEYLLSNNITNISFTFDIFHDELPKYVAWFDMWLEGTLLYFDESIIYKFQNNSRSWLKWKEYMSLNIPMITTFWIEHKNDLQIAYPNFYEKLICYTRDDFYQKLNNFSFKDISKIKQDYQLKFRDIYDIYSISNKLKNYLEEKKLI